MEGHAENESEDWDTIGKMVLRDAVLNNQIYDINQLETFEVPNVYLAYKQSQSLIDFIVAKKGKKAIQEIFHQLGKESDKSSNIDEVLKSVLNWDLAELHEHWTIYLKKEFFPMITIEPEPEDTFKPLIKGSVYDSDRGAVYSPSGGMMAFLSNRKLSHRRVDNIYLAKPDTGKILKCLTKKFSGKKYEYIVDDGNPLSWSPDGDYIAFIGRKEVGHAVFLIDIRNKKIFKEFDVEPSRVSSPSFSPQGGDIVFTGYLNGQSDLFLLNIKTGSVRQITYDQYIDETPVYNSDGSAIYYSSERNNHFKIFRIDLNNLQNQVQITDGKWDDQSPFVCMDDKLLLYSSDRNSIFNLYCRDLVNNTATRLTNTIGGYFSPVYVPDEKQILFNGFHNSQFRLYNMDFPDLETLQKNEESPEIMQVGVARESASGDELIKGEKVKFKLFPDILQGGIGYISTGIFITQSTIAFSDMFNDHQLFFTSYTFNRQQSYLFQYAYMKKRTDYFFDFYNLRSYEFGFDESIEKTEFGTAIGLRYPWNRYKRIDLGFNFFKRKYTNEERFVINNPEFFEDRNVIQLELSYISDKTRFGYFGPLSGYRSNITIQQSFGITDSYASFTNFFIDFRKYLQIGDRSLLAGRFSFASSYGDQREIFFIGGAGTIIANPFGTIRGFDVGEIAGPSTLTLNLELRFPLIDIIRFAPGIILGGIRGKFFVDSGFANIEDVNLIADIEGSRLLNHDKILNISSIGAGFTWSLGWINLNFDFARVTDFEKFYGNTIFQFWIGKEF
ncbi:MAG: hypothetical protein A2161_09470 [Candidatus Schekmanbacteria bacterium RBG_13_48_7]|uniref:Bacterial surface antigen (D15) domain-containing protein n=1 Tax=Candidatus Schekmanbacteria bacterium RBG_13_48_7 TaxID=1817878 RepID=A0A1F7RKH8_9BACT|nr:MAG: hypothetical protein A2161_09470 [Candidatus Schekmanbacteria bacterium RBG_13_48_7]